MNRDNEVQARSYRIISYIISYHFISMQGPGLPRVLVAELNNATVKPWVVYLPPSITEDDAASIPMEDDEASFHSIPMEDDEASFHSIPKDDDEASFHSILMKEDEASIPTEDVAASIPMEHVRDDPLLSADSRKAAKRTFPWDLSVGEINLASPPPPPQDEAIHAAKKPRVETPLPTSTDEATTPLPASTDEATTTTVAVFQDKVLCVKVADLQIVTNPAAHPAALDHPNARAARFSWTPEEDANLTNAVTNVCKMQSGKVDWIAAAAFIPGRTNGNCRCRWHNTLNPSIDRSIARVGE
jgi:hypothetical protein